MIEQFGNVQYYRGHVTGLESIIPTVKPKLERLWAQPDAALPPWIVDGVVYATFPRHASMDQDGFVNHWPEMQPVLDQILAMVKEYYGILGLDPILEPYLDHMWANCYTPGSIGLRHDHPECVIAGGFYFECNYGQGDIRLELPDQHLPLSVKTGDVVLWPGWLGHTILKNTESVNRISMGILCKTQ